MISKRVLHKSALPTPLLRTILLRSLHDNALTTSPLCMLRERILHNRALQTLLLKKKVNHSWLPSTITRILFCCRHNVSPSTAPSYVEDSNPGSLAPESGILPPIVRVPNDIIPNGALTTPLLCMVPVHVLNNSLLTNRHNRAHCCRACRVWGWIQVRSAGQQLSVPRSVHSRNVTAAHFARSVSTAASCTSYIIYNASCLYRLEHNDSAHISKNCICYVNVTFNIGTAENIFAEDSILDYSPPQLFDYRRSVFLESFSKLNHLRQVCSNAYVHTFARWFHRDWIYKSHHIIVIGIN